MKKGIHIIRAMLNENPTDATLNLQDHIKEISFWISATNLTKKEYKKYMDKFQPTCKLSYRHLMIADPEAFDLAGKAFMDSYFVAKYKYGWTYNEWTTWIKDELNKKL